MSLQLPDTSKYYSKVAEISSLFRRLVNNATTSVGSGIYELLIRPASAIYASVADELNRWRNDYTMETLSKSTNREVGPADAILSNYFITRNEGRRASAVVAIYSTDTFTKIPKGTVFSVDGVSLYATDTVFGSYSVIDKDSDGTYTRSYKSGEFYCFTVPVHTDGPSSVVISEGSAVDMVSYIPDVDHVVLASALSGGSDGETDAEMVVRARESVMSWIGSSATIHKILNTSGFTVLSSKSFDNKDKEMNRICGDNLYINTGSMVDTYVKTSVYPITGTITIDTGSDTLVDVTRYVPAGILSISDVIDGNGDHVNYSVIWGSSESGITPTGARLSAYQTVTLDLGSVHESITITYNYMPYIAELQSYINMPENRLLGWDIVVKSAIPAIFNLRGSLHTATDDYENVIKDVVAYMNNTEVGSTSINLADIQSVISSNHHNILTSPVIMSLTCMDYYGNSYVYSSSSGVLSASGSDDITGNMMFVCAETSGVMIE